MNSLTLNLKAITFSLLLMFLTGCIDYSSRFETLRFEVEVLNKQLDSIEVQINNDIRSLQKLIQSYIDSVPVNSVRFSTVGDSSVYMVELSSGEIIYLYNGINANVSTVKISVAQDSDGLWYWTINGDWLYSSEGNKICAIGSHVSDGKDGQNGYTPQMSIQNGHWYVSVDNGNTWQYVGPATGMDGSNGKDSGLSIITSYSQDDNYYYFELISGGILRLPKTNLPKIVFSEQNDIKITAGARISIDYNLFGQTNGVSVDCISDNGWQANAVPVDTESGVINVRAPYPYKKGNVIIVITNSNGLTRKETLSFVEGTEDKLYICYSDKPYELDGWKEGLFFSNGYYVTGKESSDNGYIISLGNVIDEDNLVAYIDSTGCVKEIFHENTIVSFSMEDGLQLAVLSNNGVSFFPEEDFSKIGQAEPKYVKTSSSNDHRVTAGTGLLGNIISMKGSLSDIITQGLAAAFGEPAASTGLSKASLAVNGLMVINDSYAAITGEELFDSRVSFALSLADLGITLAQLKAIVAAGAASAGVSAVVVWAQVLAEYNESYNQAINAYYESCNAEIEKIDVNFLNVKVTTNVSGYEPWQEGTLETGIVVRDHLLPLPKKFSGGEHGQPLTHNGLYYFTPSNLKAGATYHCWPYVIHKSRASLWVGWLGDIAGPLVRYGKDKTFAIAKPLAQTGDVVDVDRTSAMVKCKFSNVPPGASCYIEVINRHQEQSNRNATFAIIGGLIPAEEYSYRACIDYLGEKFYGRTKSFETALPDVTGTWQWTRTLENSTESGTVTLNEDGSAKYMVNGSNSVYSGTWGQNKYGLHASFSIYYDPMTYHALDVSLSIVFNDIHYPTSGEGTYENCYTYYDYHVTSYPLVMSR